MPVFAIMSTGNPDLFVFNVFICFCDILTTLSHQLSVYNEKTFFVVALMNAIHVVQPLQIQSEM